MFYFNSVTRENPIPSRSSKSPDIIELDPAARKGSPEGALFDSFRALWDSRVPSYLWVLRNGVLSEAVGEDREAFVLEKLNLEKKKRQSEIDKTTSALISLGFESPAGSGVRFSFSQNAQINYTNIFIHASSEARLGTNFGIIQWPIKQNSKDDQSNVILKNAEEAIAFYGDALRRWQTILTVGSNLKEQVRNSTDISEILAIVDGR